MAKVSREAAAVNARIVYWGPDGAGKTTNLRSAYSKLRPDHRGEIRETPSRVDPSVSYEILPISLGEVAGIRTQIEMVAAPGGGEQGPTRKQLLDQVDGVVLVVDASAGNVDRNAASLDELREALAAYGRDLADLPVVIQYNKRDVADAYALDDLHRRLDLPDAPVFQSVATDGTGVLQTLSTISKRVIRALREQQIRLPQTPAAEPVPRREDTLEVAAPPAAVAPEPELSSATALMEQAILDEEDKPDAADAAREAATLLDHSWPAEMNPGREARLGADLSIVSVGEARRAGERSVQVPLVLGDGDGGTSTLVLTIQLDALLDEDPG